MEHKHIRFRRITYLYLFPVLVLLFTLTPLAQAGISGPVSQTDAGADRLVYYYDIEDRQSYVQIANLANTPVDIHVQIFIVNSVFVDCEEIDFNDILSPGDVHTYDMSNIEANGVPPTGAVVTPGTYGFVVISRRAGASNGLVGTMRIVDNAGYEYRANAAAPETAVPPTDNSFGGLINFNNANGHSFSELIGFSYFVISPDSVAAAMDSGAIFGEVFDDIQIFDDFENDISCSPQIFSCSEGNANIAIENGLPNTKGNPDRVCGTTISAAHNSGHLRMPFVRYFCNDAFLGDGAGNCLFPGHFVGFIGLNNGGSSGSFDSWWEEGATP